MHDTRTRLLFFACLKAGAALKNAAPAPGSDLQKNRLQAAPAPQHWIFILKLRGKPLMKIQQTFNELKNKRKVFVRGLSLPI